MIKFESEVNEGDTLNREGLSAKMYFRVLYGSNFKRFEESVINNGLNYGYSILRSQISKTIIAKGLLPGIGIIHKGYNNPFNLSDDIIEVFRPLVDWYVYTYLKDAIVFKREHRLELIKLTTKDVLIKGCRQTLLNAINIFIDRILDIFEFGDISKFEDILYYMGYRYMRMLLFFDLPVKSKVERKIYSKFRNALIKKGFFMIQYSVYAKIYANRDAAEPDKCIVRKIVPEKGNLRIMIVTEKQYSRMELIIGGISNQEKILTEESFIIL